MNILIIGNGARERFFKILSESLLNQPFSINPNAAIQKLSTSFKPFSFNPAKQVIKNSAIEMVIVGQKTFN